MPSNGNFLKKVKDSWPLILGFVSILAWIITSIASASVSVGAVKHELQDHEEKIVSTEEDLKSHKDNGSHKNTSERLIKLESDVNHIQTTQSENFKDIKDQLNTLLDL